MAAELNTFSPLVRLVGPVVSGLSVVLALACFGSAPTLAAGKQSLDWKRSTKVETQAESSGTDANPMCEQIGANIGRRIATMKALKVSIANAANAPPSSVKSALEGMFGGTPQPSPKTREFERKFKQERRSVEDLNAMMQSLKCQTVDIDQALAKQTAEDRAGPEAPKAMPDDLVQTPNRY